jgi:hypothetical protein
MTKRQLEEILTEYGLEIDDSHGGAGNFVDLFVGTGSSYAVLAAAKVAIEVAMGRKGRDTLIKITQVTNREHASYGLWYLEIGSFWVD